jgi:glycosyltransferase involved in cell wall biosynthesis
MRQWFERTFPSAPSTRNFVIPNGFDAVESRARPSDEGVMRIVHAGDIYGSRSLVPLLRAIRNLSLRHPERRIVLTNYGPLPTHEVNLIREAQLSEHLEELPRVPFAELFGQLQRAHVLLAVVSDHMTYSTPYKVYDYMAAGRPILALAPANAALHDLLAESGAGESVEPQDIESIERVLEKFMFASAAREDARVERYRWVNLAQQYRAVIEAVAAGSPATSAPTRAATADS